VGFTELESPRKRIDLHESFLTIEISPKTTPIPFFGTGHQSLFHRIPMPIPQLLDSFLLGANIEVVKTLLPGAPSGLGLPGWVF